MKINRIGSASATAALAVVAMTALAACGSSSNNDSSGSSNSTSTTSSAAAGTASAAAASDCFSGSLNAAGSTAQQNAIMQVISTYQTKCPGAKISYNGTGSGAGVTSFISKQIDFAGSDSALDPSKGEPAKAAAACGSTAWDIPMVTGPIAVSYNLPGVAKLNLTDQLIAQLFSGKITNWDNAAIAAANPGVKLPNLPVSVFFRSDSSGTTDNFTTFMHATDPTDWPHTHNKIWSGSVGQGKAKTAGVASAIKSTKGGIGYVEWSYAIQNNTPMATVNGVALTADSAGKAVASAKIIGTGNDLTLSLDYTTKTPGAYPIILVTYEIACSKYSNASTGADVKDFLSYMSSPAVQSTLTSIGSAPLPAAVQTKVVQTINAIN